MNNYLFDQQSFKKLYNCSYYNINLHPIEERKDVFYGIIMIIGALIFQALYFLVIPVLWQSHFQKQTCYKLMSVISIVDVFAISINGLLTGYFAIIGAVYCSMPNFMLWMGPFALGAWMAESDLAVILALNRCLTMVNPKLCAKIFTKKSTYFMISFSFVHAIIISFCTPSVTFSAFYGVWLLNPHAGYPSTGHDYVNLFHDIHNISIAFLLAILYAIFVSNLCMKKFGSKSTRTFSFSDKPIFFQVFIMSFMNFTCALIYVYEQHFPTPKLIMQFSQFGWMCIHGFPSIIYLVLNKSIRRRVFKMIKLQPINAVSTTAQLPPPKISGNHQTTNSTINNNKKQNKYEI